jgi:hypothetical protein
MQSPKRITSILLSIIILATCYLGYWGYSTAQKTNPANWLDVVAGTAQAPIQYRIGVIFPAYFLTQHSPLGFRHIFAAVDIGSAFLAVFALYFLLRRSAVYQQASAAARWFGSAAFVLLVQFYFGWLLWYQRPETLATAALLALSLLLLTVRVPLAGAAGIAATIAGLLVLALAQGFVRADVAFSLHVGVFLICLFSARAGNGFALSRWVQAGTSLVAAMLCGGLQFYLMHIVYPTAKYLDSPMFQLIRNIMSPSGWIAFFLFLAPLLWTLRKLYGRFHSLDGPVAGFLAGSAVFCCLWAVVGRVREVRIFLPFALSLVPLTVEVAIEQFEPKGSTSEAVI